MIARLLLAGALVAVLAAPARAQTPTSAPRLTAPLDRCYVSADLHDTQPIHIEASNFGPNAMIDVFIDNLPQSVPVGAQPPVADAAGMLTGDTPAPYQPTGQRSFALRLTQANDPTATVTATSKVTALEVSSSPANAATSAKVRFRGRGFIDPSNPLNPIYAHYVLDGKVRATVTIGKPRFDCGQFSVRRPQFPMKHPKPGVWTIQFDQQKTYSPQPPLFATLRAHVTSKGRTKG
jgi:hypothetical protein